MPQRGHRIDARRASRSKLASRGRGHAPANEVLSDGSSFNDLTGRCADEAINHGALVSCVSSLAAQWLQEGLITNRDKKAIERCAAGPG